MEALLFEPIYKERVWGGRGLAERLNRDLPYGPIGESWEIVDRPEADSHVRNGAWAGRALSELRRQETTALLGPAWDAERPFPILVKWLDCQQRLSLQVHPPAAVAPELGGEPKTENWYVVAAEPGAALLAGLREGVTREQFEAGLRTDELEPLVCKLPSRAGDSLFVESGRLHAIDGGNFILEIQKNSDTTYRVYDWGRVGLDGQPRELHVAESMRSIDFEDFNPTLDHPTGPESVLADSDVFRLRRLELSGGGGTEFPADSACAIVSVIEGAVRVRESGQTLRAGDNALLPYAGAFTLHADAPAALLVTDRFA
ncbi:MAG: type I phosphomannose isomerase catalytic subunit [Catalinimonas sp.]